VGPVIPMIGIALLIYAFFRPLFPLGLAHSGLHLLPHRRISLPHQRRHSGYDRNIFASYILIFVIFGAFMEVSGSGKVFCGPGLCHHWKAHRRARACLCNYQRPLRDGLGKFCCQCHGGRSFYHSFDETHGLSSPFCRGRGGATSTGGQYSHQSWGAAAFLLAEISGTPT